MAEILLNVSCAFEVICLLTDLTVQFVTSCEHKKQKKKQNKKKKQSKKKQKKKNNNNNKKKQLFNKLWALNEIIQKQYFHPVIEGKHVALKSKSLYTEIR